MITDDFPELEVLKSNFQGEGKPHTDNAPSPHKPPALGDKGYDLRDTKGWIGANHRGDNS